MNTTNCTTGPKLDPQTPPPETPVVAKICPPVIDSPTVWSPPVIMGHHPAHHAEHNCNATLIGPCGYMEMLEYMDNITDDKENLKNLSDHIY